MRTLRSRFLRGLAALQLVLLPAAQLVDGTGAHRCPEHDAALGPASAGAMHHGSHGHRTAQHICTCLGACTNSSVAFAPTAPVVFQVGSRPAVPVDPARFDAAPRAPLRLLPFAVGPPRIA